MLDTGDIPNIKSLLEKITKEHPDLDCLINNAGVQRPLDVNKDPSEFLEKADQEIDINVRGPMHLAVGLLEHFKVSGPRLGREWTTRLTKPSTTICIALVEAERDDSQCIISLGLRSGERSLPGIEAHVNADALCPLQFSIINPCYNGTKAMVHFWTMNLR